MTGGGEEGGHELSWAVMTVTSPAKIFKDATWKKTGGDNVW